MDYSLITNYFPNLTPLQQQQFAALGPCYQIWNARINVISRKDIDHLYLRHVLHSLSIAKLTSFPDGSLVLDVGTGGGFPGIPLSILFPQTHFFLCDSVAKKIKVVTEIASALALTNVTALQIRAEEISQQFDFVVSRAVAPLSELLRWVWDKTAKEIICLKGGDLEEELQACVRATAIPRNRMEEIPISRWFTDPFFGEKKIVSLRKP